MREPQLEPVLDRQQPRLRRLRRHLVFATGFFVGTAATVMLVRWHGSSAERPVIVSVPQAPVVVTVERPAPPPAPDLPPAPTAAPAPMLGCPKIAATDDAIGAPIATEALPRGELAPRLRVVAAARAPQVAMLVDGQVLVSDDHGARFRPAFADRTVDDLAISRTGVLYAQSGGAWLGTRMPDTARERWREVAPLPCTREGCRDRIATFGDRVAWMRDDRIATSADHGRSWRQVPASDFAWAWADGQTFAWRGALYQVNHETEMCGIDDSPVWRLTASDQVTHTIFHNNYEKGEHVLLPSTDVAPTWTWRERCWGDEYDRFARCKDHDPARSVLLAAKTLLPVEGGRTLTVHGGSLVELCDDGARQIYRAFPFEKIDAVDSAGRPLVVRGGALLQWSPVHGWRTLHALPEPPPPDGE